MSLRKHLLTSVIMLSLLSQQAALAAPPPRVHLAPLVAPAADAVDSLPLESSSAVGAAADTRTLPTDLLGQPELIERRTANSATYRVGPDRYTSIVAAGSLHYLDGRGQWQIIDPAFRTERDSFLVARNSIRSRAGLKTAWLSAAVDQTAVTWQATTLGTVTEVEQAGGFSTAFTSLATQLPAAPDFAERLDAGSRLRYTGGWSDPGLTEELVSAPDSVEQLLVLATRPQATRRWAPAPDFLEMRGELKLMPGATLWVNGQALPAPEQLPGGTMPLILTEGALEIRDAGGQVKLLFAPVRAFESGHPATAVAGEYAIYPTGQPGTWLVGLRTPWRWWVDPTRRYPAAIDPTMEVLRTTGYGGGLAWVCNQCVDSGSQAFQFGGLLLGSYNNSGSYKGYIQFNHIPFLETNNPVSVTAAYLDVAPSAVNMPFYQFDKDQYPSWKKYWTQQPATLYDLGPCPAACNGFSLASGAFPAGLDWANSPGGTNIGTQTLAAPPPSGGTPQTTSWDVTNQVRQWNQQFPRPADGPAFRLSLNTDCPTDDFTDSDDDDNDDQNGKYVPECTRMFVPVGNVRLRIEYDARVLVVNTTPLLNAPGVPSYVQDVFKDTTTNHQYDLALYAGLPHWRGVAVRANHATSPAPPGWTNLKIFHQATTDDLVELGYASTQHADQTAFALIDDHNPTSPSIGSADLRAEVIASNQNDFDTDEDRNYRIDYVAAQVWTPQVSTRFTGTVVFNSAELIELREFLLGAGETVKIKITAPATATLQFVVVRPTSGADIGAAVRTNKTNSDGFNPVEMVGPPTPGADLVYDDDFVPSMNGPYALAIINQGRPLEHPHGPGAPWPITVSIFRCPAGSLPTDKYPECQPVIIPHDAIPGPYNYVTPMTTTLGLSLWSEGGFTPTVGTQFCTHNEQQGTPILGPDVSGRYIAVAQGSVCYTAATNTLSTTVDSAVLLIMPGNVAAGGETRGEWASYVFNYGSTIYPLPANYPTGELVRTSAGAGHLDPLVTTRRRVNPFLRWETVFTATTDYLDTTSMQAAGDGTISVPVVIDASQPTPTTWQVPWSLYPDTSDPALRYVFTLTPVQTPLYAVPTNLASLALRLLGPTAGALDIADYWKTEGGPDTAQFRASDAKVTHDPKLGSATKLVQAVVLAPGEAREPDGIQGCGPDKSCLDIRRDDYVWTQPVKVWDLPDVHIQDDLGSVAVSKPGQLSVFSIDHPAATDVSESFSIDTWNVTVSMADEPCQPGGPVVTVIRGVGNIALPSLGNDGAVGPPSIEVTFRLCEAKLNEAALILDISPAKIPVGNSGLGVYLLGGTITINPDDTVIALELGWESMDGATLTDGDGTVTISTAGLFSLQSSATLVAWYDASLLLQVSWNPLDLLVEGEISCCGELISGNLHMHAWIGQGWQGKYSWLDPDDAFHFSGSIQGELSIPEGYVADLGVTSLPPVDIQIGVKLAFGEFCTNSNCSEHAWGLSAVLTIAGYDVGLYMDTEGPEFILGTDDHVLIDQFGGAAQQALLAGPAGPAAQPPPSYQTTILQPGNYQPWLVKPFGSPVDDWPVELAADLCVIQPAIHTCPFQVDPGTGRALFVASWQNGSPVVELLAPDNTVVGPGNAAAYGVTISSTQTNLLKQLTYAVNPVSGPAIPSGTWKLRLSSLGTGLTPGLEHNYKLLFAADPPAITLALNAPASLGVAPDSNGLVTLTWTALRGGQPLTSSSEIELFYTPVANKPITPTEMAGSLLASELGAASGSYVWNTNGLASGEYAVGARIDDHLYGNPAAVAWAAGSILVNDTTPPPIPSIVNASIPLKDALIVRWQRDLTTLDLAGYLVEYTIPEWDTSLPQRGRVRRVLPRGPSPTNWFDVWFYNEQWIRLGGLLNGEPTTVCVRAYDASGNVSGCTPFNFDLPLITTERTGAPGRLTAGMTPGGGRTGGLSLTWDAPDFRTQPAGYLISYHPIGCRIPGAGLVAEQGPSPIDAGDTLNYLLTGLTPGQAYEVGVHAYMADGYVGAPMHASVLYIDPTDADADLLPDEWERLYNAVDAGTDLDRDGLANLQEFQMALHPLWADSDGDRYYDAEEASAGTSPCGPDHPPFTNQPKLTLLGQGRLAFQAASNAAPTPEAEITILNLGGGTLAWTAQASDPWITLGATSGGELASLPVGINPAGLAPGKYTGQVTILTGGAGGAAVEAAAGTVETAIVTVALEVLASNQVDLFLPFIRR